VRQRVHALGRELGRRSSCSSASPGSIGHSNGAEQIAVKARDVGIEVVYEGIRLTPRGDRELGARRGRARDRSVDPLRLARRARGRRARARCARRAAATCPVVVGRIIPRRRRAARCAAAASRRVYTPKDFDLTRIMDEIVDVVPESRAAA
jgi:(2R)-ethylmalonyl-CoA mutase